MEKIKFFDIYLLITMIGNIFQILGSIISIYENLMPADSSSIVDVKETCIGIGCMCCWFSLIKFLNYNKDFRQTTDILSTSTSNFLKFVIGVIPLYMGMVYLGRCLFWKYQKFQSTDQAIIALFSIMAGDIITETYTDLAAEGLLAVVYLTVWIILFMAAVHNVFISIISEGFRNKFLEDRYQELFNLYALGDKEVVSKWTVDEKER
jgi:Polycystin cation channel